MAMTLYRDRAVDAGASWRVDGDDGGMDVLAAAEPVTDGWIAGELRLEARTGGLGFRLAADGSGYFVELRAGSPEVSLQKWLPATDPRDGHRSGRYAELQRGTLRRTVELGECLPFQLLIVGPYVECSLDGEVVLAELSAERTTGKFGVWAESGAAVVAHLRWAPMRRPEHGA
jgi:hypothetical protein